MRVNIRKKISVMMAFVVAISLFPVSLESVAASPPTLRTLSTEVNGYTIKLSAIIDTFVGDDVVDKIGWFVRRDGYQTEYEPTIVGTDSYLKGTTYSTSITVSQPGTYVIRAYAETIYGRGHADNPVYATVAVPVPQQIPETVQPASVLPVINSVSVNPSKGYVGDWFEVTATTNSAVTSVDFYAVKKNGTEEHVAGSSVPKTTWTYSFTINSTDYNAVKVIAKNSTGQSTSKSAYVDILPPPVLLPPTITNIELKDGNICFDGTYSDGTGSLEVIHRNSRTGEEFYDGYINPSNGKFSGYIETSKLEKGISYSLTVVAVGDRIFLGQKVRSDSKTISTVKLPNPVLVNCYVQDGEIKFDGTYSDGTGRLKVIHKNNRTGGEFTDGYINYSNGKFSGNIAASKLEKGVVYTIYVEAIGDHNYTGQSSFSKRKNVSVLKNPKLTKCDLKNGSIVFEGTHVAGVGSLIVAHKNNRAGKEFYDMYINYSNGKFSGNIAANKLEKGASYTIYVQAIGDREYSEQVANSDRVSIHIPKPSTGGGNSGSGGGSDSSNGKEQNSIVYHYDRGGNDWNSSNDEDMLSHDLSMPELEKIYLSRYYNGYFDNNGVPGGRCSQKRYEAVNG